MCGPVRGDKFAGCVACSGEISGSFGPVGRLPIRRTILFTVGGRKNHPGGICHVTDRQD